MGHYYSKHKYNINHAESVNPNPNNNSSNGNHSILFETETETETETPVHANEEALSSSVVNRNRSGELNSNNNNNNSNRNNSAGRNKKPCKCGCTCFRWIRKNKSKPDTNIKEEDHHEGDEGVEIEIINIYPVVPTPLPLPLPSPQPQPQPPTTVPSENHFTDDDSGEVLRVVKVELKLEENGPLHRTEKYDVMTRSEDPHLVIRRGQDFYIDVHFNRPFLNQSDGVSFLFSVADGKPSMSHGTLVSVPLINKENLLSSYESPTEWHAFIHQIEENKVTVLLKTSAKSSVCKWKLAVDTKLKKSSSAVSYTLPKPIYILYNPWNPEDDVFLSGEEYRGEFILEDSGLIWRGSHNRLRPTPWVYSQFEPNVLDCAIDVLSKHVKPSVRGDCVKTVRALSALVNSQDDDGIIVGNWSDDFSSGTAPSKWSGSGKILQEYHDNKKPVKYGQCWVFAGVLTSVCRALGIPSRPVTNFSSAHDTQSSLTIDYFVDGEGKPVEHLNTDSIWNFHVWTEVWMKREDMGDERYWGWQAIDSTPQEQSDDVYRMGPASVEACRRGEIKRHYDVDFLFSEVNADKVYWRYHGPTQPLKLLSKKPDRTAVGLFISTKAVGKFDREDITFSYKFPEKSSEERDAMLAALKQSESSFSRYYLNEEFSDVRFDFHLIDDIVIGSPFRVLLTIKNTSKTEDYDVKGFIRIDTMLYTGKLKDNVTKNNFELSVEPRKQEEVVVEVNYSDYGKLLTDEGAFNIAVLATVKQTDFEYFAQDDFRVRKPDIKFKVPQDDDIYVGLPVKVTVFLKNPLPVPLQRCSFRIDAPGLGLPNKIRLKETIKPGETATAEFELRPRGSGEKTITAKFNSLQLRDVDGFVVITVNPSENEIIP